MANNMIGGVGLAMGLWQKAQEQHCDWRFTVPTPRWACFPGTTSAYYYELCDRASAQFNEKHK